MLASLASAALSGMDSFLVQVEVDSRRGLPKEIIVGLPDSVVKESRDRIRSAIINSGFEFPRRAYTINLAPAELKKEGPFLDVPIALGVLHHTGQIDFDPHSLYIGELSLNGDIKPIRGIISICHMAVEKGFKRIFIPKANEAEARFISGITTVPVSTLSELVDAIPKQQNPLPRFEAPKKPDHFMDFSDVRGQAMAKRVLEIAAAGHHNVLFVGPPGSGKTMLLKRLPTILPDLTIDEAIESIKLRSISAKEPIRGISLTRPFRHPHHSVSYAGMAGGGTNPLPGEISLAHHGVLFLDELPEFGRQVLECLRQPLEDHQVTISRANATVTYPARFMFVAAMNPCPCGYFRDRQKKCSCQDAQIKKYWKKISGPILDRIDIIISVPRLETSDYFKAPSTVTDNSETMGRRVFGARCVQYDRLGEGRCNGDMHAHEIRKFCRADSESQSLLKTALDRGLLTGRSFDRVLKVARTIADLGKKPDITLQEISEAMQFRGEN